ncbi:hypothetical protein [Hydrogenovibrio kuenenii]|uniref:hypothetical protein n=1 Tax=Hydrogenovibrio kuenenii TaxID=63658 RepID=UPI0004674A60|nr:hypothetical protein [Hydrogenovibrio kuenenii]
MKHSDPDNFLQPKVTRASLALKYWGTFNLLALAISYFLPITTSHHLFFFRSTESWGSLTISALRNTEFINLFFIFIFFLFPMYQVFLTLFTSRKTSNHVLSQLFLNSQKIFLFLNIFILSVFLSIFFLKNVQAQVGFYSYIFVLISNSILIFVLKNHLTSDDTINQYRKEIFSKKNNVVKKLLKRYTTITLILAVIALAFYIWSKSKNVSQSAEIGSNQIQAERQLAPASLYDSKLRSAIKNSDDLSKYELEFLQATNNLIESGKCSLDDFEYNGGWSRVAKRNLLYFTFCGGHTIKNRIYLNVSDGDLMYENLPY